MTYRAVVVEDEETAGAAHAAYLTRLGFDVVGIARSGRDAVRLLAQHPDVDLVLLDFRLPDTHGLQLLAHLRVAGVDADVIAVTSVREVEAVRQAVAQGVVAYLIKPFSFAAFKARIEQYVAYRDQLDAQPASVAQSDVDAVLRTLRPHRSAESLPKGLTAETVALVVRAVQDAGPLSAGEAAERVGTSRVTARRYLEHLVDTGVVERRTRHGGSGRPEIEYGWR
ncbi:Response regulator of citrate/malate metabolism [Microlunatus sagamiharensis]|uniref:Transcriptional regulatory protein n=1 Tax=Microlunatus sagamiharensis TaxID=546874 RepID=A0A1H2LKI8_9ACTN|nr:response regulator [Microlunatus sagamiharensis]SDU80906.1 Response regulator of citrate/malate metabolism [Microlunatus sagamiharensis]